MSKIETEVEIGFKIKNSLEESIAILKANGFDNIFKTETHDLYFCDRPLDESMSEQQLKFSCVRFRHSHGGSSFDNYHLSGDPSRPDKFKCDFDEAAEIIVELKKKGFMKVFDTFKTDNIFTRGTLACQLQKINHIGLLNYIYDESVFGKSAEYQYGYLKKLMLDMGFELEFEDGVDKFRTLLAGTYRFSKNQNGDYDV